MLTTLKKLETPEPTQIALLAINALLLLSAHVQTRIIHLNVTYSNPKGIIPIINRISHQFSTDAGT